MPSLELAYCDALDDPVFQLIEARALWDDGARSTGWGRDVNVDVAIQKAINESVERYAYQRLPDAVRAPATGLDCFIDPDALIRYGNSQYADPDFGLSRFDASDPRLWLRAVSVIRNDATHVLADCVCNPRAFDACYRARLVTHATTSGCASDVSLDAAILRATLELVERDAFMRHWFAQSPGQSIAVSTLPHGVASRLARLRDAGCAVGVACLDMGAHPTWLVWATHAANHFTSIGTACGLDGARALDTALNELETAALARIAGIDSQPISASDVRRPADHAALYATELYFQRARMLLRRGAVERRFDDACANFEVAAAQFYERLEAAGHEPHWIDLSIPDGHGAIDGRTIHTVRAIAPEMIPMAFGWGRMPLGMDRWCQADPALIHPFA